jgi:hypothetical protein
MMAGKLAPNTAFHSLDGDYHFEEVLNHPQTTFAYDN